MSQVSGIALRRCSQNVFVFVFVIVFVFVFVFVNFFGHVMSSHHSEQMSQRSQVSRMASRIAFCMSISKVLSVSQWVTRSPIELFWTAKNGEWSLWVPVKKHPVKQNIFMMTMKKQQRWWQRSRDNEVHPALVPSVTFLAVQNSSIGDLVTNSLTDWLTNFYFWHYRVTLETCDLWDIWSEWWRDMIWAKKIDKDKDKDILRSPPKSNPRDLWHSWQSLWPDN